MAIIKCKMCGGDIELSADKTIGTCECCGSTMTFPKLSDEQRTASFNRGNAFRMQGDFDKALTIYEHILEEDDTDAEAHWCCVLCRFGIEYVEDPETYEYVPTCHRASFDSILEDVDYKAALDNSDGITHRQYMKDAAKIAELQKGILATSQNEEPFDVFISYKETDDNGSRTVDATLAQDIYYRLTEKGYRVFFSKITLEGKPGTEYEPYIFAALNSSKVMILVGTSAENINSVWVKNEWSRFMAMRKKDKSKVLVPCYRDMNPYDLPEQISVLKAYDMSQIGFLQDLIHGVSKVIGYEKEETKTIHIEKETVVVNAAASGNVAPLLKRVFIFLEDGDWKSADEYCEKVLDIDPENAQAYLGKLMAELEVRKQEQLSDCAEPFEGDSNYQKVLRFGNEQLISDLKACLKGIRNRNENKRLAGIYKKASEMAKKAELENEFREAADVFNSISQYMDAEKQAAKCQEEAVNCRKIATYKAAKLKMTGNMIDNYEAAIKIFETIPGWSDSEAQIFYCKNKIEEIKESVIKAEEAAKKRKKILSIATPAAVAIIAFLLVLTRVIIPNSIKKNAYEKYSARLDSLSVGDILSFGAYEQDNNTVNGKETIEWLVLAEEDNKILVISKNAIDCVPYNTTDSNTTWGTCTLCKWLNETFINDAFSTEEKSIIQNTYVTADMNPRFFTNAGNETTVKVFLLSINEVKKYFTNDEERRCAPTAYAKAQGAYTSSEYKTTNSKDTCWWWLRSPGRNQSSAADVLNDGTIFYGGGAVNCEYGCVRPAIWICLGD